MQPTSPSPPHGGHDPNEPFQHVDIRGVGEKLHVPVQNPLGALAIGEYMKDQARQQQGR